MVVRREGTSGWWDEQAEMETRLDRMGERKHVVAGQAGAGHQRRRRRRHYNEDISSELAKNNAEVREEQEEAEAGSPESFALPCSLAL